MNANFLTRNELIPVEAIQERDIDLLILEELICSKEFRKWFLKNFTSLEEEEFIGAWHSLIKMGLGESDLAMKILTTTNALLLILIENKIDAGFMPDQAIRYRKRGEEYLKCNECHDFIFVLIAPEKYLPRGNDFSNKISYEAIRDWMQMQNDDRRNYKAELLEIAIEKLRRGYIAIPDMQVTAWQHAYYELATNLFPELKMRKPQEQIPKGSRWLRFVAEEIERKGATIVHKTGVREFEKQGPDNPRTIGKGSVDLQFIGLANRVEELNKKFKAILSSEMRFVKATNAASLRILVKPVNTNGNFEEEKPYIIEALQKARILYDWAIKNYPDMQ